MSEINDGFGDNADLVDYDELIRSKERLIKIQAAEQTRGSAGELWDDLLNEARITIWQVAQKHPEKVPAYTHAATRMRIGEVLSRGTFFGMERTKGHPTDPLRRKDRDSFDDPDFAVEATAPEVLDSVLLAYHEGEILQALRVLTERQRTYVVLRFWGGWTNIEIADALAPSSLARAGRTLPSQLERDWRLHIRPQLREQLAHLVEV